MAEKIGRTLSPNTRHAVINFKVFVAGHHETRIRNLFDDLLSSAAWENCHADHYHRTCLKSLFLLSVQQGCYKETKRLLEAKFDPNSMGSVPLVNATQYGHYLIVLLLLSSGAKIQSGTSNCYSALFHAKNNHQHDIAQLLESQGATLTESEQKELIGVSKLCP
jgi:hypothetical protein